MLDKVYYYKCSIKVIIIIINIIIIIIIIIVIIIIFIFVILIYLHGSGCKLISLVANFKTGSEQIKKNKKKIFKKNI